MKSRPCNCFEKYSIKPRNIFNTNAFLFVYMNFHLVFFISYIFALKTSLDEQHKIINEQNRKN